MNGKELAGTVVVVAAVILAAAYKANEFVAPAPIAKDNVSLVMLGNAMKSVSTAVGPTGGVHSLDCVSKGDGKVMCTAVGSALYHVSFAAEAGTPAFELVAQRHINGKMYVDAFTGVGLEIAAREVGKYTSAFDGQATVQPE